MLQLHVNRFEAASKSRFKGFADLQLGEFVAIAKPMAMRRYSVSSSPLAPGADPNVVTATVGQVKFTTGTGRHGKPYQLFEAFFEPI